MRQFLPTPLLQLLLLVVSMVASLLLTSTIAGALAPVLGFPSMLAQAGAEAQSLPYMRYLLFVQSVGLFLLPPLVAALLVAKKRTCAFLGVARRPLRLNVLITLAAVVVAAPFVGFVASLNAQLPLPEWAVEMDHSLTDMSNRMLWTPDAGTFLLNLLIVAILPAVGEELLFRGYLLRVLGYYIKNRHAAIIVTAVIFSTFHLQFEGFAPRLLLGVMLGYLLRWSGSLWLPIAAHFANNAVVVCTYFYKAHSGLAMDAQALEVAIPGGAWSILASALALAWLLRKVRQVERFHRKNKAHFSVSC
ncbi:MAG: CPBP family intramembrane metalloprotease [Prevotellaceae bacterium]|jgi:membrane protease YdiL (CAAX protease family)|nr:CPBP family intramembrane metalloprotease [Prevotellaceae bacterium]